MIEVLKKVLSNPTFLTVVSGTLVYALSQLYLELVINPRKEYKMIKSKIAYYLTLYANYYSNPIDSKSNNKDYIIDIYKESSNEMRKIGSELSGYISNLGVIHYKKRKKLEIVQRDLIGISNGFIRTSDIDYIIDDNIEYRKEIEELLKITV